MKLKSTTLGKTSETSWLYRGLTLTSKCQPLQSCGHHLMLLFFVFAHIAFSSSSFSYYQPKYSDTFLRFLHHIKTGSPSVTEVEKYFSEGLQLLDDSWAPFVPNLAVLGLCLKHYKIKNEMERVKFYYYLVVAKIEAFGSDPVMDELTIYGLDQIASSADRENELKSIFLNAITKANVKCVTYLLDHYEVRPESFVKFALFEVKTPLDGHNDVLQVLFQRFPEWEWDASIRNYMKSSAFKPQTLEWMLNNGLPLHSPKYIYTLMDCAIEARRSDLGKVCLKFGSPPSHMSLLEWRVYPYKISLHNFIEREYLFQKMKQFMIFANLERDEIPADVVSEICHQFILAYRKKLLLL